MYHLSLLVRSQDKFRFQTRVCDGCHNMTQKSTSFYGFAIFTFGRNDYRVLFWFMCSDEAVSTMSKYKLSEESG